MSTSVNMDTVIELYNHLTDVNFLPDDINFLESIKYKMNNGNRLLESLITLQENNIPFTIVKGFILEDEEFSKFEKCIISLQKDIQLDNILKLVKENIKIKYMENNLYEMSIS